MHGKTSEIHHDGQKLYLGLDQPLVQTRYHSLVIDATAVPAVLEVTAWSRDDLGESEAIMGIRHKTLTVEGVQFILNRLLVNKAMSCCEILWPLEEVSGHEYPRSDCSCVFEARSVCQRNDFCHAYDNDW